MDFGLSKIDLSDGKVIEEKVVIAGDGRRYGGRTYHYRNHGKILQKGRLRVIFPVSLIHYPQLRTHLPIAFVPLAFNTYLYQIEFFIMKLLSQL